MEIERERCDFCNRGATEVYYGYCVCWEHKDYLLNLAYEGEIMEGSL